MFHCSCHLGHSDHFDRCKLPAWRFEQMGKQPEAVNRQPKIFLRAHLPNQQRTSVQVIPGLRLRDALSKALKRRNLTCQMCEVTTLNRDKSIHWDTDISLIRAEEVYVKVLDKFPIMTHISHQVNHIDCPKYLEYHD